MTMLKAVYLGTIQLGKETLFSATKPSLQETVYALNDWFFGYFFANKHHIQSLPPLDDWTRSEEDGNLWTIHFPDAEWLVSVKSELLEFK